MGGQKVAQTMNAGAFTQLDINQLLAGPFLLHSLSTDTTVNQHTAGRRLITYAGGALAVVLAAPTAGADDGKLYQWISTSAEAHTITATGLLNTGTASVNVATFAADAGAGLTLMAYQGAYYVVYSNGITFS